MSVGLLSKAARDGCRRTTSFDFIAVRQIDQEISSQIARPAALLLRQTLSALMPELAVKKLCLTDRCFGCCG